MRARLKVFPVRLVTLIAAALFAQQTLGNGPMMGPSRPSISHAPSMSGGSRSPSMNQQPRFFPQNNIPNTSPALPAQSNTLQPNTVQPNTAQPNAPAAAVAPLPNQAPPPPPTTNAGIAAWVASLTPAEKAAEIAQLQGQDNAYLYGNGAAGAFSSTTQAQIANAIATDSLFASDSAQQQQALTQATVSGDPAKLQTLLTPQQLASQGGQTMMMIAQTKQTFQPMIDTANNGALTTTDIANAAPGFSNITSTGTKLASAGGTTLTPQQQQQIQTQLQQDAGKLYTNSQLIAALKAGTPAQGAVAGQPAAAGGRNPPVPRGDHVRIVLVPGLDQGAIVPLDGMVMVGVGSDGGDPGDVTLGDGNVALAAGFPVGTAPPAPDAAADSACTDVVLRNAASSAVDYTVDGKSYSMEPSFKQTLDGAQPRIVEFDRGGDAGTARYSLTSGTYKFKKSDKGWDLFEQSFDVTLDNRDNKIDFHYVRLNKRETLPAGKTVELSGRCPSVVRFDNSAGQIKEKQLESGDYRVALADDNTLDLFAAADVISPAAAPPPEPAPSPPAVGSEEKAILAAKPLLPAGGSSEKAGGAAKPPLPAVSSGEKAVVAARPLPPHFKIFDPLAAIRTPEKSLASETKEDAKK